MTIMNHDLHHNHQVMIIMKINFQFIPLVMQDNHNCYHYHYQDNYDRYQDDFDDDHQDNHDQGQFLVYRTRRARFSELEEVGG